MVITWTTWTSQQQQQQQSILHCQSTTLTTSPPPHSNPMSTKNIAKILKISKQHYVFCLQQQHSSQHLYWIPSFFRRTTQPPTPPTPPTPPQIMTIPPRLHLPPSFKSNHPTSTTTPTHVMGREQAQHKRSTKVLAKQYHQQQPQHHFHQQSTPLFTT